MLNKHTKEKVAIDISDFSIEVLQLEQTGDIHSFGRGVLQAGIVHDGHILKGDYLESAIRTIFESAQPLPITIKNNSIVYMSLPESHTYIHAFDVKKGLSEADRQKQIEKEIRHVFPFPIDELAGDYVLYRGEKSDHLVYAATPSAVVQKYVDLLRGLGFSKVIVDVEAASVGRAVLEKDETHHLIVDIGARTTTLSFFGPQTTLMFTAKVAFGGDMLTKRLEQAFATTTEQAEYYKRNVGMQEATNEDASRVRSQIEQGHDILVSEMMRAIEYYERTYGSEITDVSLVGGGALVPYLDRYLTERIQKRVVLGDPSVRINEKGKLTGRPGLLYSNVIGLALRSLRDPVGANINLNKLKNGKKRTHRDGGGGTHWFSRFFQ